PCLDSGRVKRSPAHVARGGCKDYDPPDQFIGYNLFEGGRGYLPDDEQALNSRWWLHAPHVRPAGNANALLLQSHGLSYCLHLLSTLQVSGPTTSVLRPRSI